jgi:hypothetical protein
MAQRADALGPKLIQRSRNVGRSPWLLGAVTPAEAHIGAVLIALAKPDLGSGADEGVCPTRYVVSF